MSGGRRVGNPVLPGSGWSDGPHTRAGDRIEVRRNARIDCMRDPRGRRDARTHHLPGFPIWIVQCLPQKGDALRGRASGVELVHGATVERQHGASRRPCLTPG